MLAQRTLREQILLLVALVVIVGMGYLMFRYRPARAQIAMAQAQLSEAETALSSVKWPAPVGEEIPTLEAKLAETQTQINRERRTVEKLQLESAPTDEDLRQLNVEIAKLAESSGVELREHKPYDPGAATVAGATENRTSLPREYLELIGKAKKSDKPLEIVSLDGPFVDVKSIGTVSLWSLERITVVGTFTELHRFIDGLQTKDPNKRGLPWRVTIVQIEIDAEKATDSPNPRLKATMIVGM